MLEGFDLTCFKNFDITAINNGVNMLDYTQEVSSVNAFHVATIFTDSYTGSSDSLYMRNFHLTQNHESYNGYFARGGIV